MIQYVMQLLSLCRREKMSNFMESRREARMYLSPDAQEVDARTYTLVLGGVVVYGLVLNIIMCATLGDSMSHVNPIALLIGYFVSCLIGIFMSHKSNNPIISFIGYNLVVVPCGLIVSLVVSAYVRAGAGDIVLQAFIYTAIITACMIGLSIAIPEFFSKIGGLLLGALVGLILAELINIFFIHKDQSYIAWIGAAIFSLYIGYDYWRAQQYAKTIDNAVDSAVDIYLDMINLFLKILRVLGSRGGSSRRI